jgi:hypothetical protein
VVLDLSNGRHVQCSECGADLVIRFKYYTLYVLICVLGALFFAHFRGLQGPVFIGGALIYLAVLLVVGLFIVVRFFPLKVGLNDKPAITKLRL